MYSDTVFESKRPVFMMVPEACLDFTIWSKAWVFTDRSGVVSSAQKTHPVKIIKYAQITSLSAPYIPGPEAVCL